MAWLTDFLERMFPTRGAFGGSADAIVIDIPAEMYYKEMAIHSAASLISNAISRSEIKVFSNNKPVKNGDYYLLNVSPNRNETSSLFWHKVINKMIYKSEALVVEAGGFLYCADSYSISAERPILGDTYCGVTIGNFTFEKIFTQDDAYLIKLDNHDIKKLIDGMYRDYGKILASAAKQFKASGGQKFKIHIDGVKAGDEEFNKEFEEHISEQLKSYMMSDDAIYPEFDGYKLEEGPRAQQKPIDDFIALKKDLFSTVATALHIPDSIMTGNINNMDSVIDSFLTFGIDPFADAITEALNKRAGIKNFKKGNYYQVNTGKIRHKSIFELAQQIFYIISSGVLCIDEVREEIDRATLDTEWSKKHFMTKNFEEIEKLLKDITEEGGEKSEG